MAFLVLFFGLISQGNCQNVASGSAMDLAKMNQNMMNTNCPISPCQSACLVQDAKTGCYVCNPSCTPAAVGGGGGNMAPNMMPPMSPGMYSVGCSYGQCQFDCEPHYDQLGCLKCVCTTHKQSVGTTGTTKSTLITPLTTAAATLSTSMPTNLTTVVTQRTTTIPKTTTGTSPTPSTTKYPETTQTTIATLQSTLKLTHPKQDDGFDPKFQRTSTTTATTSQLISVKPEAQEIPMQDRLQSNNDFDFNKLSFILFGLMGIMSVFTTFFFYSWRKTLNKLRRNKDELYFVQKAYRQNSNQSTQPLWSSEMMDPVYTEVPPIPPPRPPVDTCTPLRTLSVSSETPTKVGLEEKVHDYLELI